MHEVVQTRNNSNELAETLDKDILYDTSFYDEYYKVEKILNIQKHQLKNIVNGDCRFFYSLFFIS